MYVPSLHYLLLIDEGKLKPFDEVVQLEYTTKCDGMFRLQKCIALLSIKAKYVGNRWSWKGNDMDDKLSRRIGQKAAWEDSSIIPLVKN